MGYRLVLGHTQTPSNDVVVIRRVAVAGRWRRCTKLVLNVDRRKRPGKPLAVVDNKNAPRRWARLLILEVGVALSGFDTENRFLKDTKSIEPE